MVNKHKQKKRIILSQMEKAIRTKCSNCKNTSKIYQKQRQRRSYITSKNYNFRMMKDKRLSPTSECNFGLE